MPRLNTTIHINNADGRYVFGPDDEVPKWAVDKINKDGTPNVWADESDGPAPVADTGEADALKARIAELEAALASKAEDDRSPAHAVDYEKSSKTELVELAKQRGIDVPDGATKSEIADLLRAADEAVQQ